MSHSLSFCHHIVCVWLRKKSRFRLSITLILHSKNNNNNNSISNSNTKYPSLNIWNLPDLTGQLDDLPNKQIEIQCGNFFLFYLNFFFFSLAPIVSYKRTLDSLIPLPLPSLFLPFSLFPFYYFLSSLIHIDYILLGL